MTATDAARPQTGGAAAVRHHLTDLRRSPEALRGALVLMAATAAALTWANLSGTTYDAFWHLELGFDLGDARFALDLRHWVNDLLVALFFGHVTLEVRRELELGELRDRRLATAPALAALAGLVVPALVYVTVTWGTAAVEGWGVVVSTDTAFALGVLALAGRSVPASLRAFLVTLVVVDDVGALAVVAFAYTDRLSPGPLLGAAAGLAVIVGMRLAGVWRGPLYLLPSVAVWAGFFFSGVHATLAGVAIALLLPVFSARPDDLHRAQAHVRAFHLAPTAHRARTAEESLARAVSINERAHRALTPYVAWFVLPVFALANAGVRITPESLTHAVGSRLTWGVVLGLVVGKAVAIVLTTWLVVRGRPGSLGPGTRMSHVLGVSMLAGMGFTISLFVTDLAFDDPLDVAAAQLGVLAATVVAGLAGGLTFAVVGSRERRRAPRTGRLLRPLDPARDPVLGAAARANVTVVEYGAFTSPFSPDADELRSEVARFGTQVAYTFRHLPVDGPLGRAAAVATEAAALQGRFWQMRDALIRHAPVLTERQIRSAAAQAGLNLARFDRDRVRPEVAARVDEDVADAAAMGLRQAPAYFVDGLRHEGLLDVEAVAAAVRPYGSSR